MGSVKLFFMSASTETVLPLILPFPATLGLVAERLQELGFTTCELEQMQQDCGLALVPIAMASPDQRESHLTQIARGIERYRARFPNTVFIGLYSGRLRFKSVDIYRAGITCLFSIPLEEELFVNKIYEVGPLGVEASELSFEQLMRVNVGEIEKAVALPFNLYLFLPMNRKIILYYEKNRPIDERFLRKFKENPHYNLYIRRSQLKVYMSYCHSLLLAGERSAVAADEGRRLAGKISGLMSGFFNDSGLSEDDTNAMLINLKNLTEQLEDQSGSKKDLVKAVTLYASQQMTHYTHAQNVAAYSCLFGLALGLNEPETLRMGGLLHDLGLSDLPTELIGKDLDEMTTDQVAKYKLHPGGGKFSIEERKLSVPRGAMDMVMLHHERPDGSGYPYGKKAEEIPLIARICALADEFDKLTSVRVGKRQLSPADAMRRLAGLDGKPAEAVFDSSAHKALVELFVTAPAPTGTAVVDGGGSPAKPVAQTTIAELMKQPRFATRARQPLDQSPETLQSALRDLSVQLKDFWSGRTLGSP